MGIPCSYCNVALGERWTTSEVAIDEACDRKGITWEVATHDRKSPLVWDVLNILGEMGAYPSEHVVRVEAEGSYSPRSEVWTR